MAKVTCGDLAKMGAKVECRPAPDKQTALFIIPLRGLHYAVWSGGTVFRAVKVWDGQGVGIELIPLEDEAILKEVKEIYNAHAHTAHVPK